MRGVAARLVLKELKFLQKQYCEQVSLDMLDCANPHPTFMERIITSQSRLEFKVMLIVFFDIRGLVHHECDNAPSHRETVCPNFEVLIRLKP